MVRAAREEALERFREQRRVLGAQVPATDRGDEPLAPAVDGQRAEDVAHGVGDDVQALGERGLAEPAE
jgi:hypothetical protein